MLFSITFQMPSLSVNLRNFILAAILLGSVYLFFITIGPHGITTAKGQMNGKGNPVNLRNLNLRAATLPVESFKGGQKAPGVNININSMAIDNINIYYRIAEPVSTVKPTGQTLFLLHGAAFSSKTWANEIGTIQTMASLGHRIIAVDLPGKSKLTFFLNCLKYLNYLTTHVYGRISGRYSTFFPI